MKGFKQYHGGLNVNQQSTDEVNGHSQRCENSIFTKYNLTGNSFQKENIEIMFHVSTMLPFDPNDDQQVARKRFIGNDIVAIVYQEPGAVFNPSVISSHFLHSYIVVQPELHTLQFKVVNIAKNGVSEFLPAINCQYLFNCDSEFREFLLSKLINAELASMDAPTFSKLQKRTRLKLFEAMTNELFQSISKIFFAEGPLRSPCQITNLVVNHLDEYQGDGRQWYFGRGNKRSGSILKSLKRTFQKYKPPSFAVAESGNESQGSERDSPLMIRRYVNEFIFSFFRKKCILYCFTVTNPLWGN